LATWVENESRQRPEPASPLLLQKGKEMFGAIFFVVYTVVLFVMGAMYARNRILNNLQVKGYNTKDIIEVVKIWT
jgi:hypothetical protein